MEEHGLPHRASVEVSPWGRTRGQECEPARAQEAALGPGLDELDEIHREQVPQMMRFG